MVDMDMDLDPIGLIMTPDEAADLVAHLSTAVDMVYAAYEPVNARPLTGTDAVIHRLDALEAKLDRFMEELSTAQAV